MKRLTLFSLLIVTLTVGATIVFSHKASAANPWETTYTLPAPQPNLHDVDHYKPYCGPANRYRQFGRCANQSYYLGNPYWKALFRNGGWIWPRGHEGVPASWDGQSTVDLTSARGANSNDMSGFINVVRYDLYDSPKASVAYAYVFNGAGCWTTDHDGGDGVVTPAIFWCEQYARSMLGASYVINTMLGINGNSPLWTSQVRLDQYRAKYCSSQPRIMASFVLQKTGVDIAKCGFNRWSSLVDYYHSQGRINYNLTGLFPVNNANGPGTSTPRSDTVVYREAGNLFGVAIPLFLDPGFYINDGPDMSSSYIRITNPDGTYFQINKHCGNITGPASPLTINTHDFTLNPTTDTPALLNAASLPITDDDEVPQKATFPYKVQLVNGSPVNQVEIKQTYSVLRFDPATSTWVSRWSQSNPGDKFNENFATNTTKSYSGNTISLPTNPALPGGLQPGDLICLTVTVTPGSGTADPGGTITTSGSAISTITGPGNGCKQIHNTPYVSIYGGDTFAGVSAACTGWPASGANEGGIWGNLNTTSTKGSAAQLALFSLSKIKTFNSSAFNGQGVKSLHFSNSGMTATADGGEFSATHCPEDYYNNDRPASEDIASSSDNLVGLSDGAHFRNSALTITKGGALMPPIVITKRIVVYVNGDVTIKDDINYSLGVWSDMDHIPSLTIIASGNIYINPSAQNIDATLIAQKSAAGTIYTCGNSGGMAGYLYGPTSASVTTAYNNCNTPLVINGALIARRIKFNRTFGSQRTLGQPAEKINYLPELYMSTPLNSATSTAPPKFDFWSSPPPLL